MPPYGNAVLLLLLWVEGLRIQAVNCRSKLKLKLCVAVTIRLLLMHIHACEPPGHSVYRARALPPQTPQLLLPLPLLPLLLFRTCA